MDWQETDESKSEKEKLEFETVEALPILGLIASVMFIAIFIYMAHA